MGIERRLMRVRDGDVPSPQHLAVRRSKRRSGIRIVRVLNKGVTSGLAAQRTSLVKEVIET